ncbi:hypothetical protein SynA1825c_01868 [Synechococcus sp. A18-25c]|nr:hypothetical protein SynA1825c_01868 [Synechococcus sp. A18-25c]
MFWFDPGDSIPLDCGDLVIIRWQDQCHSVVPPYHQHPDFKA